MNESCAQLTDADLSAIRENINGFTQTIQSGDKQGMAALFTKDGNYLPPNHPMLTGREAIETYHETFPPLPNFNLTIDDIDGCEHLAYVRGKYSFTMEIEGVPEPIPDNGKYVTILRKQEDGSWLAVLDTHNTDLPLPE